MSDTPKTDELARREFVADGVWIRHARELERENATLRAELGWKTKRIKLLSDSLHDIEGVLKKAATSIFLDAFEAEPKEAQP